MGRKTDFTDALKRWVSMVMVLKTEVSCVLRERCVIPEACWDVIPLLCCTIRPHDFAPSHKGTKDSPRNEFFFNNNRYVFSRLFGSFQLGCHIS